MSESRAIDQANNFTLAALNQHAKTLPKAELTHDVKGEITKPIRHVPNSLTILHPIMRSRLEEGLVTAHDGTELANVEQHQVLHSLQRIFRERLAQDTPLASVNHLIDDIVGIVHSLDRRERVVEFALLHLLAVSIDVVQTVNGVDRNKVRSNTDVGAIFPMLLVQPEMSVALEAVVQLHPGSYRREERSWDLTEGVEEDIVRDIAKGLQPIHVSISFSSTKILHRNREIPTEAAAKASNPTPMPASESRSSRSWSIVAVTSRRPPIAAQKIALDSLQRTARS